MTRMQHKGIAYWHRYGRGISIIAMGLAVIWMWIRAYSGVQNPNTIPLLYWAVFSSILLWGTHFGVMRLSEAFLGFSAGVVFAPFIGFVLSDQPFIGIIAGLFGAIMFETLCQKWIDRRMRERLEAGER